MTHEDREDSVALCSLHGQAVDLLRAMLHDLHRLDAAGWIDALEGHMGMASRLIAKAESGT